MDGVQRHMMAVPRPDTEGPLALANAVLRLAWGVDPAVDVEGVLRRLRRLLDCIRVQVPPTAEIGDAVYTVNEMLFFDWGFAPCPAGLAGPRDDLLDRVLARRCGGPFGLGVLYLVAARKLRLPMEGALAPGRFLLRLRLGRDHLFLDPAAGGVTLFRQDLVRAGYGAEAVRPLDDRAVLALLSERLRTVLPGESRAGGVQSDLPDAALDPLGRPPLVSQGTWLH